MSAWTDETWAMFFELLDKGWPGELDPNGAEAYRILLGDADPDQVISGVRRKLHEGAKWRPSAAELLAAGRRDPGRPMFAEAYRLIFGARGVLSARVPPGERRYADAGEKARAEHKAVMDRATGPDMHPTIARFIDLQGVERLRGLELEDPDYGQLRRKELEVEWNAFIERLDERQIAAAALPAGDRRHRELARFDPLRALEPRFRPAGALGAVPSSDHHEGEVPHAND